MPGILCVGVSTMMDVLRRAVLCCAVLQDAMAELPACKLASPDQGLFAAALQQHESLDFFDYVPYTATQLHPHLEQDY
mgnify:CR=1 FL=1